MYIVLLGGPGAGKGTLAKQLQDEFGFHSLSPGELYRKEADLKTEFGLHARDKYWGNGNLCPDEMTNELVKNTLSKISFEKIIFDGYPRTLLQAQYLDSIANIDLVIDLLVDEDTVVKRLLRRKDLENRSDDTEEVIKQRLRVYNKNNLSIVEYYKNTQNYYAVDGTGTPLDTFDLAKKLLGD